MSNESYSYTRVSILDCRSHTWSEAPSLPVMLYLLYASVLDGKIYVAGGYRDVDSSTKNSFQVFDTETQIWDPVAIGLKDGFDNKTASIDGKFHAVGTNEEVVKKGRWGLVRSWMKCCMDSSASCEIDNVLYSASGGCSDGMTLRQEGGEKLNGLVELPMLSPPKDFTLADYGGKMAVLWNCTFSFSVSPRLKDS